MLKKNLKKLFALGLIATLGIGSLTACGGSDVPWKKAAMFRK